MADITIKVSLDLNTTPKITVDHPIVIVPFGTSPTIHWELDPNRVPSNTALVGLGAWDPRNPLSADPDVLNSFTATDDYTSHSNDGTFRYDVMLEHDGVPVPKDPEIENDPGGGHFKLQHNPQ